MRWVPQKGCGVLGIQQPTQALLFRDRHAGGIYLSFQGVRPFERLPGPELDRRQPQRQAGLGHDQAGMHREAAHRVTAQRMTPMLPALVQEPDVFAPVGNVGRILQHQHQAPCSGEALTRAPKMSGQNVFLVHALVGEKPVGRLRARPILASQRNAFGRAARKLLEHHTKPFSQTLVRKRSTLQLAPDLHAQVTAVCRFRDNRVVSIVALPRKIVGN